MPDLDDFVGGLATVLKPEGVLTIEVPHLLRMLEGTEFDTIYHEHLSYFSLLAARDVLARRGLRVFDVEELPTHGGSLRIWASRATTPRRWPESPARRARRSRAERAAGLDRLDDLRRLRRHACERAARRPARFLARPRPRGERVAAYGAAAKGNTLLNAAGVDGRGHRLRRRPQPAQAGPLPARLATSRSSARSTCAATGPTTC